jgi:hypothetical protein
MADATILDDHDVEWKHATLEQIFKSDEIKNAAFKLAYGARNADDPEPQPGDVIASRNYLTKCLLGKSCTEIDAMTDLEIAALWANGVLGYARYRASGGNAGAKRRR